MILVALWLHIYEKAGIINKILGPLQFVLWYLKSDSLSETFLWTCRADRWLMILNWLCETNKKVASVFQIYIGMKHFLYWLVSFKFITIKGIHMLIKLLEESVLFHLWFWSSFLTDFILNTSQSWNGMFIVFSSEIH